MNTSPRPHPYTDAAYRELARLVKANPRYQWPFANLNKRIENLCR
jgi:hypothetical protein